MIFTATNQDHGIPPTKKELVLEIELNGRLRFDYLLNIIYQQFAIPYKIISADIEFYGDKNFGNVQLHIEADIEQHEQLEYYLNRNQILNTFILNLNKKAV